MSTQVQFRRGTTADHSGFRGADGEVTVDTSLRTVVIHDAITNGGFPLLRQDGSNCAFSKSASASNCALKFEGDPNTGLISPVSDEISLVTGGFARLTIDSNGSVTIPGNVTVQGTLSATRTDFTDNIALILALG
tara:strand:+ start:2233 stop:2637 length:405 start_codon:yes stop_codon:yes gene_type:complete